MLSNHHLGCPVAINSLYHMQKGIMHSIKSKLKNRGVSKWDEASGQWDLIFPSGLLRRLPSFTSAIVFHELHIPLSLNIHMGIFLCCLQNTINLALCSYINHKYMTTWTSSEGRSLQGKSLLSWGVDFKFWKKTQRSARKVKVPRWSAHSWRLITSEQ